MSHLKRMFFLLLSVGVLSGCSDPIQVRVVEAESRRLQVTFSERAETTLRKDFPVTLPVSGRIGRIQLEAGDRVRQGEKLVDFDATPLASRVETRQAQIYTQQVQRDSMLDTSVEEQSLIAAQKQVDSVRAELSQLKPAIEASKLALETDQKELQRVQRLVESGALPTRDQEQANLAVERSRSTLQSQQAQWKVIEAKIAQAQAQVASQRAILNRRQDQVKVQNATVAEARTLKQQDQYELSKTEITSPVTGIVLTRHERGPKELPAGTLLLSIGRTEDIEVLCDVLSQDALRLKRGTEVTLDPGYAGAEELKGEVRLKEPLGYTKRSSLGVEQQRVRIRIGLIDPPEDLGIGYELWARFLLEQKTTLTLPASCFVKKQSGFQVWRVGEGKLEAVTVDIGTRGDEHWEVLGTEIQEGDRIVTSPNDQLKDGLEVSLLGTS